ncbi:MAG: MOSC domain-containing protein [Steroidobacteraceae bacterium]
MTTRYSVVSVQVGRAEPLQVGDQSVMSGIRKLPVQGPVEVRALGLAGDEQADPTVHGGLAKAVYAYPVEHYAFWREHRASLGLPVNLPHGSFGENLTISGVLEESLYVGDELLFPDCSLRVTQPRGPCYKLNAFMNDPSAVRTMAHSGLCGFYLSVEAPGSLTAGQEFAVRPGPRTTPLMDLFKAKRAKYR